MDYYFSTVCCYWHIMAGGLMNLYAHECCECANVVGYSTSKPTVSDTMCNDCASSFVLVSYTVFGINTYDSGGYAITPDSIIDRKWRNKEGWEYHTRMSLRKCQTP